MKIYANCPECNHDDRYVTLLPDNELGEVRYKCHKCGYEETSYIATDIDDKTWEDDEDEYDVY